MTREIPLKGGLVALIDDTDYEQAKQFGWYPTWPRPNQTRYARARINGATVKLHRFLLNAPPNVLVDHKNGNGLDNRRSNLRLCDGSQNQCNRVSQGTRTGFKGVYRTKRGKPFVAFIQKHGKRTFLGRFDHAEKAHAAYVIAAKSLHGEFAHA